MRRSIRGLQQMLTVITPFLLLCGALAQERVVAYVPNWIDLVAFAETIDYTKVTHLNIAFENPTNDDGGLSFNRKNEALLSRANEHHVPVLVSIGGGAASADKALLARYAELLTDAKRSGFVATLAEYVSGHGFAGLDVDLEGPSINQDYGAFVAELAAALRPKGKLLTAALSKGYGGSKVPDSVFEHFDFVNIMAYDAAGPWSPKAPGQHSSLEFAKDNVAYWLKRGLSKAKAVLGVPFYGYGFGAAFRKRDYPYASIIAEFSGAENADQAGDTIWYNGLATIKAKATYVKEQRLGGIMIWSLDYDGKGEKSLLNAIHETLASPNRSVDEGR
jgi:chitinase